MLSALHRYVRTQCCALQTSETRWFHKNGASVNLRCDQNRSLRSSHHIHSVIRVWSSQRTTLRARVQAPLHARHSPPNRMHYRMSEIYYFISLNGMSTRFSCTHEFTSFSSTMQRFVLAPTSASSTWTICALRKYVGYDEIYGRTKTVNRNYSSHCENIICYLRDGEMRLVKLLEVLASANSLGSVFWNRRIRLTARRI